MAKNLRRLKKVLISDLTRDVVFVNTLERMDILTLEDLMHCPFRRLMRNRVLLKHWDTLTLVIWMSKMYVKKDPKEVNLT